MRNKSIEIYRVALMVGILLLHVIDQGGHPIVWASNCLSWCVTGFVFISGWFGVRFSFSKIIKLYGTSLYCAVMFSLCESIIVGEGFGRLQRIWDIAASQWYLNAYVVLMCFSPILNEAIHSVATHWRNSRGKSLSMVLPLIVCVFVWSFATTLPIVSRYVPRTSGLTAYSFLTLIGIYTVARLMNELELLGFGVKMKFSRWLALIVLFLPASAIVFNDYNSPVALILAGSSFFLVRDSRPFPWLGKVCGWLGPSMFSVYLIHSHDSAWPFFCRLEDWCISRDFCIVLTYAITTTVVFAFCLVLDVPRRLAVRVGQEIKRNKWLQR